jgi:Uma2 family endonuclease
MLLKLFLRTLCGDEHAVSADMFVYWIANADDDTARRAPDAAVKLDLPAATLRGHGSWKTWELGVPELTVEVLSLSDTREKWTLAEKRDAYAAMGVLEFVCFDVDAPQSPTGSEPARLRVWDRIDGDFVERVVENDRTPCVTLSVALGADIEWTVAPAGPYPVALRLVRDGVLVPSPEEATAAANARADSAEAEAAAAKARIRELEALLSRK